MKRKIDFIFNEKENERKILRFYPRSSHVHGFGDECPHAWNSVYKVYYSWAVHHQSKWTKGEEWGSDVVFDCGFDECSALGCIPDIISSLKPGETANADPGGDGTSWSITHNREQIICEEYTIPPHYEITLWLTYRNTGYRFKLSYDEAQRFSDYIKNVQDYMLAHSEPI